MKYLLIMAVALSPVLTACNEDENETTDNSTKPGYDIAAVDGKVNTLQTATEGNGINIILMGDGFTAGDITSGRYDEIMNKAMDALFSIKPMPALRKYFNVYSVQKVSASNMLNGQSAFGTIAGADMVDDQNILPKANAKAEMYALSVPGYSKGAENTFFAIIMNTETDTRGVTSHGIGWNAYAFSYCSLAGTADGHKFRQTLTHELVGHGIAKLLDEYPTYHDMNVYTYGQKIGWYLNMSTTDDIGQAPWAEFAGRQEFADENIGVYPIGGDPELYKPTETSIMYITDDEGMTFNAPSRRLIYNRIMKLATGSTDDPTFEEFVAFDKANR